MPRPPPLMQAVARLATHAKNVNAVVDNYKNIMVTVRWWFSPPVPPTSIIQHP